MATVWRATHLTLGQPIALKFIEVAGMDVSGMRDRFLREARVAAAIRHRNVVDILDFGTADEGQPFMAMELLEGESLAARMTRDPPMTVAETVRVIARVLSGLGAVHDAGIQHRDLKPENVFLAKDADGAFPKLIDFGVSRALDPRSGVESVLPTRENAIAGTPQYMSPEQARGLSDVDQRSDLWSVGVMLFELLTGRLPYDADAPGDVIIEIATKDPPDFGQLRPDLTGPMESVVRRAMHKDRARRFQTAREMRGALLSAAAQTASTLQTRGPRERAQMTTDVDPGALIDAVGSAYEKGDSGLIEVGADATSLLDSILPAHGIEAAGPPPAPAHDDPFVVADRAGATTLDSAPRSRRGARVAVALLGVVALAGGVAWWVTDSRTDGIVATEIEEPSRAEPEAGSPARAEPEPTPPAEARVALEGVPEDAQILVDGEPWSGEGPVRLPRDGAVHTIAARTTDGREWSVEHRAREDGRYTVALPPAPPPATTATRRRGRGGPRPTPPRERAGELIRNPGF